MAATQPLDSRILSQLIPREYDGKSAQEGRRFLAHTRLYLDQMDIAKIAPAISWIIALNRLTDHAARWADPFIIQIAEGHTPWSTRKAFVADFKSHFCAADDRKAAISELNKLCAVPKQLGTVKEYTASFNAIAARTPFSLEDRRDHYVAALPTRLQDEFAITAHVIDTLAQAQKVALLMDQQLAERLEDQKQRNAKEQIASNRTAHTSSTSKGQPQATHPLPATAPAPATPTPPTAAEELTALRAQLRMLKERVAAVSGAQEKEDF